VSDWTAAKGVVYLVGAGPGDPGLLTRRGEALLRQADVVFFDRLASPELLDLTRAECERVDVSKHPGGPVTPQEWINAELIRRAREGIRVVRLKGGDPFVFGRGSEEAIACREAGVDCEIVAGITSAFAAPLAAGIPVLHRHLAGSVLVLHGRIEGVGGEEEPWRHVDWAATCRAADTLVILMGVAAIEKVREGLLSGGRPPGHPVAAIEWATTPRQRVIVSTIDEMVADFRRQGLTAPAVLVVGDVVSLRERIAPEKKSD
jgi:uroporphyrin-III C-methyltransferase